MPALVPGSMSYLCDDLHHLVSILLRASTVYDVGQYRILALGNEYSVKIDAIT